MEALELEVPRGFDVKWSVLHVIWCWSFFKLRQGIQLKCKTIFPGELHHSRSRCTCLQEGFTVLISGFAQKPVECVSN